MNFNFGDFILISVIYDLFDKATEPSSAPNKPMPTHVKWAAVVCVILLIATILIIAYTI